ncbi:MAG: hypothetical protein ACQEXX_25230 [Bacillota bacterium]
MPVVEGTGQSWYFPLLVRGSHTMQISSHPGDEQGSYYILGLFFNKVTHPAGLGLNPGEGSWLDRGMSYNEPDIIQQNLQTGLPPFSPWMVDLKDPNKYWIFECYNTNQGVLKVHYAHRLFS